VTEPVIETHRLRKQYGPTLAVSDLSLTVARGEAFGFLGPNGAGKTTSIKMLLGLVQPSAGEGRVLGAPLGNREARARIGFLPEHFRFHDTLSARELLRFHGRLYGLGGLDLEARIDRLLTRVDLLDAADRPLRGYSKGMVQRTGLAQALLNNPRLVFLDEPTSGLDPLGRLLVRSIIDELRADDVTVFLNSHLLGEVEATCDRVAFVKRGRVVGDMRLRGSVTTVDLELRVSPADTQLQADLRAFATDVRLQDDETVIMRIDSESRVPVIVQWLVARNVQVHAVHPRRQSLEDLFVAVMGDDERPG
jgi:ABC-2 type transport system ATP-binding protein